MAGPSGHQLEFATSQEYKCHHVHHFCNFLFRRTKKVYCTVLDILHSRGFVQDMVSIHITDIPFVDSKVGVLGTSLCPTTNYPSPSG